MLGYDRRDGTSRVSLLALGAAALALHCGRIDDAATGDHGPGTPGLAVAEVVTLPPESVPTPPPPLPSADNTCATPARDANWSGLKSQPIFWDVAGATVALGAERQSTGAALIADANALLADPRIYLDDMNGPAVAGGLESGTFRRFTDSDGDGRVESVGQRFLFTEGNEAIRRASALGFAYNQTHDSKYLVALLQLGDSLMRLPSWNGRTDTTLVTAADGTQRRAFEFDNDASARDGVYQRSDHGLTGHGLDAAHVATAASMVLAWAGPAATDAYRQALAQTIVNQYLRPYLCSAPSSAITRDTFGTGDNNWYTLIHTTALMASLAVMAYDDTWASAVAARANGYLSRVLDDLANGPSDESYLYTAYELQWVGYLAATQRAPGLSVTLRDRLAALVPSLSAMSRFYASCGALSEPGFNDGGISYRHNSRPLGLAAVRAFRSSPQVASLFEAYQPATGGNGWGSYTRDGLAEILWAQPSAATIAGDDQLASVYGPRVDYASQATGCVHHAALAGGIRAWLEGNANDSSHGHDDFGAVVADFGGDRVLYNVPGDSTRPGAVSATHLHNTVGWVTSGVAKQATDGSVLYNFWRNPGAAGRAVPATVSCTTGGCGHAANYTTYSGAAPSILTDSTALFTGTGDTQRRSSWTRELFADNAAGLGRVVVRDVITSRRNNASTLRWTWYVPKTFAIEVRNANTFMATYEGRTYALITDGAATLGSETFGDTNAANDLWRITVDRTVNDNQTVVGGIRVVRY